MSVWRSTRLLGPSRHLLGFRQLHNARALALNLKAPKSEAAPPPVVDQRYNHPILKRIPKFLRPYTTQFIHAPVSHVTAFLILHELTAIVPLIGIWYALHNYHDALMVSTVDLPTWALEKGTKIIDSAMESWDWGKYSLSDKIKFITEGAYAYVIVKALLPVRLVISILGMPWFAKWFVLPFTRMFGKLFERAPKKQEPAPKAIQKPRL